MALSAFEVLLIVIAGGAILGCLVWIIHLNIKARKLGLPAPSLIAYFRPPSSNPVYLAAAGRGGPRQKASKGGGGFLGIFGKKKSSRGEFGPLGDDSGAWDSRGYSAYDHDGDAELGLRVDTSNDARTGRGQGRQEWDAEDDSPPRGRSRSRSPRPGYDVRQNRGPANGGTSRGNNPQNPFTDDSRVRRSTDTGRSSVFTEETF